MSDAGSDNSRPWYAAGFTFDSIVARLIRNYIFAIALVAFFDGFLKEKFGFPRLETLYYTTLLLLLIWRLSFHGIRTNIVIYLSTLLAVMLLGVLVADPVPERLASDVRYFFRSYIIAFFVYEAIKDDRIFKSADFGTFFGMQWLVVTSAVLAHLFFGFGGVTVGDTKIERAFYSSFFEEGNVVVFFYTLSWFYLFCYSNRKLITTLLTLIVVVLMSSKAGVVAVVYMTFFYGLVSFQRQSRWKKAISSLVLWATALLLVVFFYQAVDLSLWFFVKVAPDAGEIVFRLRQWDPLTVLTSTRDLRVERMFQDFNGYSTGQILFGIGFDKVLRDGLIIESDPFDILQAFGIIGLAVFGGAIVAAYRLIRSKISADCQFKEYVFVNGTFYATIIVSTLTGHVLLTPMTMVMFGVLLGYAVRVGR